MVYAEESFSYSCHIASLHPLTVSTFLAKCIVGQGELNERFGSVQELEWFAEDLGLGKWVSGGEYGKVT
jgi:hypothetical protein